MKALLICPTLAFFVSHRMFLISALEDLDLEVILITGPGASEQMEREARKTLSNSSNIKHIVLPINSGISVFGDVIAVFKLLASFWQERDEIKIIHGITAKGCLITTLVSHFFRNSRTIFSVSGLGQLREDKKRKQFLKKLSFWLMLSVHQLFKISISAKSPKVIVQTEADMDFVIKNWGVRPSQIECHKFGVGVDLKKFPAEIKEKKNVILMASRLLYSKGVFEFIDSAKIVKRLYPEWTFELYGAADYDNGDGISSEVLTEKLKNSSVQWKGYISDLSKPFNEASIMCLPTRYGEGIPKVLIEGAAAGCYLITSALPGITDLIEQGMLNGTICDSISPKSLADAICKAIENKSDLLDFGQNNARNAQNYFSVENILTNHKTLYREVLGL